MLKRIAKWIRTKPFLHSLQIRMIILMLFIGIVPSVIMQAAITGSYKTRMVNTLISNLQTQMQIIANHLIAYNYLNDTSSEVINAELEQLGTLNDGRIMIVGGDFKIIKDTYAISEGRTMISEEVIRGFKNSASTSHHDDRNGYIEMTIPIQAAADQAGSLARVADGQAPESGAPAVLGVMVVSVSTDSIELTVDALKRRTLILELLIIIVVAAVAIVFARILVRPFVRVSQAIGQVKDGFASEPISVPDYAETEQIVDAFNQILGQMQALDASRQEFVSNVSHELKTPLTSMKVLAESLNGQEDAPVELYREFMEDISQEIDREDKIINDLLSLVKLDKSMAGPDISPVDINELIETILKRLRPIARSQDIELTFESRRAVTADVDEVKIGQAISNLVENAIKYNKEHGWVRVLLDADHQFFTVEVSDSGIGIPQDEYDNIFQRFYRVDKSHSKQIGGTGLGLSITRGAVLLHRGSIQVSSVEGEGTVFTMKIPLNYIK